MRGFLLFSVVIIVSPLSAQPSLPSKIEKEVRLMLDDYFDDIKREGLMAEMKYLDTSADFFWVPPGFNRALSRDSVVAIITGYAPKVRRTENMFETLRVVPLSDELATYTGRVRSIVTDLDGKVTSTTLMETAVVVKRKQGWKLLSGQTSVVKP